MRMLAVKIQMNLFTYGLLYIPLYRSKLKLRPICTAVIVEAMTLSMIFFQDVPGP